MVSTTTAVYPNPCINSTISSLSGNEDLVADCKSKFAINKANNSAPVKKTEGLMGNYTNSPLNIPDVTPGSGSITPSSLPQGTYIAPGNIFADGGGLSKSSHLGSSSNY